jgi:hypothetical protein
VKQAYCDQETGKDPDKLNFIFNNKTLDNHSTLNSIGMTRRVAIFTVTTKVVGGAQDRKIITIKKSNKSFRLRQQFTAQHTVRDVKQAYCDQENNSAQPSQLTLLYNNGKGNKTLSDEATLGTVIMRRVAIFTLITKVVGGAAANVMNSKRVRKLDKSDAEINKMITGDNDCVYYDHVEDTAKMACGHSFYASTMFDLIKRVVTKNEYEWEIKCPAANCGTVFDFEIASKVADLNDDEYLYFADEFAKRSAPETKQCPDCKEDCERPADLTKFRVNCIACSGGDWCFLCAGKWHGGGFTVCGNNGCPSAEINEVLRTCPIKKTTYTDENGKYVEVPQIRACPNCLEFIEHDDRCKHMRCHACGHEFCFSCLQGKVNGAWPCNSHRYQCDIAPRQVLK